MESARGCERKFYKPVGCNELQLLAFAPGFSVWLLFILLFCFCSTESIVWEIKGLRNEQMTQLVISIEHDLKSRGWGCHSADGAGFCKAGDSQPYSLSPQSPHVRTLRPGGWIYLGVPGLLTPDPVYCEVRSCSRMISTGNTAISILKWVLPFLVFGLLVFGI